MRKLFLSAISLCMIALSSHAQVKKGSLNIKSWIHQNPSAVLISTLDLDKKTAAEKTAFLQNPKVIIYNTGLTEADISKYEARNSKIKAEKLPE
jgi:hypothetical protein